MKAYFKYGFFVALVCMILFSCKKDVAINRGSGPVTTSVAPDTVFPGNYFPSYPGSWWYYDTGDSVIVDNNYHAHIFNAAYYTNMPYYDTLVLPRLRSNPIFNNADTFVYVNKYGLSKGNAWTYREPAFIGLLSDTVNGQFGISAGFSGHQISGLTIQQDVSMTVNSVNYDSVIVCIHYDYWFISMGYTPQTCWTTKEYFAKHVGMILRETRNNFPMDTIVTPACSLVSYLIQ